VFVFTGKGLLLGPLDESSKDSMAPLFGPVMVGVHLLVGVIGRNSGARIGDAASEDE